MDTGLPTRRSSPAGCPAVAVESGRLVVARHRSPRGPRVFPTLPLPLVGSSGGGGPPHAARTAPSGPVPAPVLRRVGLATAATVAVTGGAVALTGTGVEAPPGQE